MTTNENGGCPEGQTADGLDAVQGVASTVPQSRWFPLSHGTPPRTYTPVFDDLLALVRESDENATDGDPKAMDEWMSYRIRWQAYLAGGEA